MTENDDKICQICAYDIKNKKTISCSYCSEECCVSCVKNYLLELNSHIPKCMFCSKEWSNNFLCDSMPKSFHNKVYREHKSKCFLDVQKALLPDTQDKVELHNKIKDIKKNLSEQRKIQVSSNKKRKLKWNEIKYKISLKKNTFDLKEKKKLKNDIKKLREEYDKIKLEISNQRVIISGLTDSVLTLQSKDYNPKIKDNVLCRCPEDNCKGFVKTKNKKCGICETVVCSKCFVKKEEDHECKKEDILSVELIKKDSKLCPDCNTFIFRIQGCNQMWCTQCHSRFCWKTLKRLDSKFFHNPHQAEWERQNMRSNRENPECVNTMPRSWRISEKLNNLGADKKIVDEYHDLILSVNHISDIELPRYPLGIQEEVFEKFRIDFLNNDIDEKTWNQKIKKAYKKMEKNTEIRQILDLFCNSSTDIVIGLYNYLTNPSRDFRINVHPKVKLEKANETLKNIKSLRDYVNINLGKVSDNFNNKVPFVSDKWILVSSYKLSCVNKVKK